jgi:hypothetical protein
MPTSAPTSARGADFVDDHAHRLLTPRGHARLNHLVVGIARDPQRHDHRRQQQHAAQDMIKARGQTGARLACQMIVS